MRFWADRPLFANRQMRRLKARRMMSAESYRRMTTIGQSYGIDGFSFFPQSKGRAAFLKLHQRYAPKGFVIVPELLSWRRQPLDAVVGPILSSNVVKRVDGHVIFTSYRADRHSVEEWDAQLRQLRAKFKTPFRVLLDVARPAGKTWAYWMGVFNRNQGKLPAADQSAIVDSLRRYLAVADGLHFATVGSLRNAQHRFDARFYRQGVIPLLERARAGAPGKLLGLSATLGYFNPGTGSWLDEDGTRTLRSSLSIAFDANPDIIVLSEWDEANENTSFRPTIYNSFSTQRVVRFMVGSRRGLAPSPNPGDDPNVPNLVLSYRKSLVLGELLELEVLNIPDGKSGASRVHLELRSPDGAVVKRFPWRAITASKLMAVRFSVASESLAAHRVLVPVIVFDRGGRIERVDAGLHPIRLMAMRNVDRKWVKQPLRDVYRPSHATSAVAVDAGGGVSVRGSVSGPERLASVELVADGEVVWADEKADEFRRRDGQMLRIDYWSPRRGRVDGFVEVRNASPLGWWRSPYVLPNPRQKRVSGRRLRLRGPVGARYGTVLLSVGREQLAQAAMLFTIEGAHARVPLRRLATSPFGFDLGSVKFVVAREDRVTDLPGLLGDTAVSFSVPIAPAVFGRIAHLRVITTSGRVFRGAPMDLRQHTSSVQVGERVYSDSRHEGVKVMVDASRAPTLRWQLAASAAGTVVPTNPRTGRWVGLAGGPAELATGAGPPYAARRRMRRKWEDAVPHLTRASGGVRYFDGGDYIGLPTEALPQRAGFKVTLELMTRTAAHQVILSNRGYYPAGLEVWIAAGKLFASYTRFDPSKLGRGFVARQVFNTNLRVSRDRWVKIVIGFDENTLHFDVDGDQRSFPCSGPGLYLGPTQIGRGIRRHRGLQGYLRRLSIGRFGG